MSRRLALVIGSSLYRDETLSRLVSPDADVGALADTLLDPEMGGFDDVKLLVNMVSYTVRKEISEFFSRKTRTDLLLLYFSGHGVLDDRGQLYLAVKDTDTKLLRGTAIPARYITEEMDNSYSQRQVLILDCCHSGAFARGTKGAPGASVGTANTFEGTGFGRVVLTASDATQYAWEGNQVVGDAENSLFTHFLIEGIQTGKADSNQDGQITIDELYDYAYTQILRQTPKQTPGKWSFKEQGELIIAKAPITKPVAEIFPERKYVDEEQEKQLQKLYTDGLSAYWLENWDQACQRFETILEIRPGYQDVETKLEEAKRRRNHEELYLQALEKYHAGDLAEGITLFETLLSQAPDYKDAQQRLDKIRHEKELADLFAEAQQLFDSGKYHAVVKIFESIQALSPDFVDQGGLLEKSKLKVLDIERSNKLEDLYRRAIFELDAGRLKQAKLLFLQLQSEEKGFKDTEKLLERVDSLIVKEAERTLETQQAEKDKKQAEKVKRQGAKIKLSQRLARIPVFVKIAVSFIVLVGVVIGGYLLIPKEEPLSGRIIIWHSLGANVSSFEQVVHAFEEKNPGVDVETIQFSRDDLRAEFQSSAVAGTGPDLVLGDDDWGPQWYQSGLIVDVSSVRVSKIDKVAMQQGHFNGVQVGLPYQLAGVLMFRNKKIITEPAASFEDLKQKAQIATVGHVTGALLDPGTWYSLSHLYALGGNLMTDEGDPAFNTAEGIAWLEMLKEFKELGAEFYSTEDGDLFKQRRVGVVIEGTWSLGEFYDYLGDDLVVDPWPENMSGFVEAAMIYLSVNSAEENLKAAQGFMAYLLSSEAQTLLYNSDPNFIPVNTSIKITDTLRQQVKIAFKDGIPVSILPEFGVYFAPMDEAIQRVVNGWVNPQASLDYAERIINQDLAEMRGQ